MLKETEYLFGVPMSEWTSNFIRNCRETANVEINDFDLLVAMDYAVGYAGESDIDITECLSHAGIDIGDYTEGDIYEIGYDDDEYLFRVPMSEWISRFIKRCRKATSEDLNDELLLRALDYAIGYAGSNIDIECCLEYAGVDIIDDDDYDDDYDEDEDIDED